MGRMGAWKLLVLMLSNGLWSVGECQLLRQSYLWSGSEHAATPFFAYQQHVYQHAPFIHPPPPPPPPVSHEARHGWVDPAPDPPPAPAPLQQPQDQEPASEPEPEPEKPAEPILNYSSGMTPDGDYSYKYETADGISREETGIMKRVDGVEGGVREVRGSYSYPSPDGRSIVRVEYVADESGFRSRRNQEPMPQGRRYGRRSSNLN